MYFQDFFEHVLLRIFLDLETVIWLSRPRLTVVLVAAVKVILKAVLAVSLEVFLARTYVR